MNTITDDGREFGVNGLNYSGAPYVLSRVRVIFSSDAIRVCILEPFNKRFNVSEVMIGPLDLHPDAFKGTGHG
jgi:hypothetical protein